MNCKEEFRLENRNWALNKCWTGADLLNSGTCLRQPAVHGVIGNCTFKHFCVSLSSVCIIINGYPCWSATGIIDTYVLPRYMKEADNWQLSEYVDDAWSRHCLAV
jgi:hypothetical protein